MYFGACGLYTLNKLYFVLFLQACNGFFIFTFLLMKRSSLNLIYKSLVENGAKNDNKNTG